jgi:hypothetical protein
MARLDPAISNPHQLCESCSPNHQPVRSSTTRSPSTGGYARWRVFSPNRGRRRWTGYLDAARRCRAVHPAWCGDAGQSGSACLTRGRSVLTARDCGRTAIRMLWCASHRSPAVSRQVSTAGSGIRRAFSAPRTRRAYRRPGRTCGASRMTNGTTAARGRCGQRPDNR